MNLDVLYNQIKIMENLRSELIFQKEKTNYWINVLHIQGKVLTEFIKEGQPQPKNKAESEESIQAQIKADKVKLLLNELFKTLEGK